MLAISARRRVRDHKIDLTHHGENWTADQEAELVKVFESGGDIHALQAVTKRTYNATVGRLVLKKLVAYDNEERGYIILRTGALLIDYTTYKKLDDKAPALISKEAKEMLADWAMNCTMEFLVKKYQLNKKTIGTFLVDREVAVKLGTNYYNVEKLIRLNQMSVVLNEFSEKNSITSSSIHDIEVVFESDKDQLIHKLLVINS